MVFLHLSAMPAQRPSAARSNSAMLILLIFSIASKARRERSGSGSASSSCSRVGTTCQDSPHRSLIQPQCASEPPSDNAAQSRSTSAWSRHAMWKETASVNGNWGPPLRPTNRVPASVNSTVSTIPAGPLGVSAGERGTRSIRESGSNDTEKRACGSGCPSNHRNGVTFCIMVTPFPLTTTAAPPKAQRPPTQLLHLLLPAPGGEGRRLVELANLTLAVAGKLEEPLGPFDRLVLGFDLKQ